MSHVTQRLPWRITITLLALALVLPVGSCGVTSRPDAAEWRSEWLAVVDGIPDLATIEAATTRDLCSSTLAMLRSRSGDLTPTPDLALDDTVRKWIEVAEDTFFECPPRSGELDSFAAAYAELERFQAEVAAVLELDE